MQNPKKSLEAPDVEHASNLSCAAQVSLLPWHMQGTMVDKVNVSNNEHQFLPDLLVALQHEHFQLYVEIHPRPLLQVLVLLEWPSCQVLPKSYSKVWPCYQIDSLANRHKQLSKRKWLKWALHQHLQSWLMTCWTELQWSEAMKVATFVQQLVDHLLYPSLHCQGLH